MTDAEHIAYLRDFATKYGYISTLAVCDLAERALLTDDEAEAVRYWLARNRDSDMVPILARLLPAA